MHAWYLDTQFSVTSPAPFGKAGLSARVSACSSAAKSRSLSAFIGTTEVVP